MKSARAVRQHLVDALQADLVGPFNPAAPQETLQMAPSRWYLTGFIVPAGDRKIDHPEEEETEGVGDDTDAEDGQHQDPEPKRRRFAPASLGVSLLVPKETTSLSVTVQWADYRRVDEAAMRALQDGQDVTAAPGREVAWRRSPEQTSSVSVSLDELSGRTANPIPNSDGLVVSGVVKALDAAAARVPEGTRALSIFVVNQRDPRPAGERDAAYAFQISMLVESDHPFVPRPNPRDEVSDDVDARVADLQFRHVKEYATGHGVAVETVGDAGTAVRTTWLPSSVVKQVRPLETEAVELLMSRLGQLTDAESVAASLGRLVPTYKDWIAKQAKENVGDARRRQTRDQLMSNAAEAAERIASGIRRLQNDPQALRAFCLANQAMEKAAWQRNADRYAKGGEPKWRLFQLAFILLNIDGLVDHTHNDRNTVELIFFPTGGGKTEAYLGVIAFSLVLRRLRGATEAHRGLGVAVILRYTLRLLTLDQLDRAASLICALEWLRLTAARDAAANSAAGPNELGEQRFAIGLWVGSSGTANTLKQLAKQINEFKQGRGASNPCPLSKCPWCGTPFEVPSYKIVSEASVPVRHVLGCMEEDCAFSPSKNSAGLPVVFVDEQLYRELPCFVVGTVDKFALLPYRAQAGMLFGRATHVDGQRFYGSATEAPPTTANELPSGLLPPELIVQDELHLISGPLGTMVGLYESAVDYLCEAQSPTGERLLPKVIASTATVRQADEHVRALFGRSAMQVFPPPGIDENETYFSRVDHEHPGRLYVGVGAAGRPTKNILLRTYSSAMAAAQHEWLEGGGDQPADSYMTLVGYFNALRELGGMRRLVEDDVRSRCRQASQRVPLDHSGPHPWFADREVAAEPAELTSRESTTRIAATKTALENRHDQLKHIDVVLASNMISVGVDIDRLGLMVVAGQPKTTAEYIQATSRVGRRKDRPGLVLTCLNLHRPRDRSHYESFVPFHRAFYRFVEPTSLTPFSLPALERGFAGALLAMLRHSRVELMPADSVGMLPSKRALATEVIEHLARRASSAVKDPAEAQRLESQLVQRGESLIDELDKLVRSAAEGAATRKYSSLDKGTGRAIIRPRDAADALDVTAEEQRFVAPTSMRDVEPSVDVWVYRKKLPATAAKTKRAN